MALKPRTGNQYVISSGEWSARRHRTGCQPARAEVARRRPHRPFDPNRSFPAAGWVLAPYPNRVTNGQYSFDGEDYRDADEFDRQSSCTAMPTATCGALLICRNHT